MRDPDARRGMPSTAPLWRDRRFSTYWGGQTVSQLGDRVSELALPLIAVTMLHASPTAVGLLTAAVWAPNLLSLFVGAWVDRQQRKRRLLIWGDLLQCVVIFSLPVAYYLGTITFVHLVAVALLAARGPSSITRHTQRSSSPSFDETNISRRTPFSAGRVRSRSSSARPSPVASFKRSPHRSPSSSTGCPSSSQP
ncbi:MAG TPA: MFS transporter [Candidatus Lustribacter sp.]|nr:MFS transporter [Candidatus Lustribacter sp.]